MIFVGWKGFFWPSVIQSVYGWGWLNCKSRPKQDHRAYFVREAGRPEEDTDGSTVMWTQTCDGPCERGSWMHANAWSTFSLSTKQIFTRLTPNKMSKSKRLEGRRFLFFFFREKREIYLCLHKRWLIASHWEKLSLTPRPE